MKCECQLFVNILDSTLQNDARCSGSPIKN